MLLFETTVKQSELKEERREFHPLNSIWECDPVRAVVLVRHLCPQGGYLGLSLSGKGHVWHLAGRGQACCKTAYNAQDSPHNRE